MGLFSFVKNAGAKLFGRGKKEEAAEAPNQAELDAQKALELENLVRGLGLDIEDLYIEVNGDVASVSGKTCCIDDKEKVILACGNVEGIAQVDDRISVEEPEVEESAEAVDAPAASAVQASTFYTVVKGDTLSKIAKVHYNNAGKYHAIFEANRPMLKSPDLIYPGQVLRIPPLV